jgi:hypothetical protein
VSASRPQPERGEQVRIRDWVVNLYYLPRCPSERADRSGWYAYAEHDSGAMVPPRPRPEQRYAAAREDFERLMGLIR